MQLVFPTTGRASILGRPVGDLAVRQRIGYLPENPYFYDNLTAEELLDVLRLALRLLPVRLPARASRLLDEVGLGAERRMQLRKYSKGMVQRVGIAQSLARTIPKSSFSTSRCRASIRSAAATSGS